MKKFKFYGLILFFLISLKLTANKTSENIPANLEELRDSIEKILAANNIPGAGIAIVTPDTVWSVGIGYANLEDSVKANENTMFRIGSTSKMFVALAILKLQEEGKVSLKDKVRDLVPEIEFKNKWAETNPILVEHLLEHTTGWDDFHFCEYAYQMPDSLGVKAGLDYHPASRTSRWVPGTRTSYCNSGPPVAAYIVEKISGQSFEDYIQQSFFDPMGMKNMTYFNSNIYKKLGATLYDNGEPQEYWHIIMRPSGAINASAKDMTKMLQFFVNRGIVDSTSLVSELAIDRMEKPLSTPAALQGKNNGYGLNNYTITHNAFIYHGHGGSVGSGQCSFAYMPQYKVGYASMINSSSSAAYKISTLIMNFQTQHFPKNTIERNQNYTGSNTLENGYYLAINPRTENLYFSEYLTNYVKINTQGDSLLIKRFFGKESYTYYPESPSSYRSAPNGLINLVVVDDPIAGKVMHNGSGVFKHTPVIVVFGRLLLAIIWILLFATSLIWAIIWAIQYWRKKIGGGANIWIRLSPLATTLILFLTAIIASGWGINNIGIISFVTLSIMVGTLLFALGSLLSMILVLKFRNKGINKFVYWVNFSLCIMNVIVTIYLLQFGVIGMRLWA